jgi:hypothetical protein
MDEILGDLNGLRAELTELRSEVAAVKRMIQKLPTRAQFAFIQGGFVLAIFAAAFALLRLAPPH